MQPTLLPLFPLRVVVFPRTPLPLHIFEERYKLMIERCLEGNRSFGVTLMRPGTVEGAGDIPHEIGTVARKRGAGLRKSRTKRPMIFMSFCHSSFDMVAGR